MLSISPCLVDVNADGTASPRDALHVANTIESGGYVAGADVNSDGEVSSDDFDLVVEGVTASASEGSGGDDAMGHRDPGIDAFINARRGDKVARIPERLLEKEVGCGSGQAMAGSSGSGSIDLKIWRGANQGEEVPSNQEDTVGSFVVANLNDTDADQVRDWIDTNGVPGGDEDMMQIQIPKPPNYDGSDVTLWTIWPDQTPLWSSRVGKASDHIPWDTNGEYTFTFQAGETEKTFFVSSDVASYSVRDIIIVASYLDASDSVLATAVWAELEHYIVASSKTFLRAAATPGANTLNVANASIFSVGNQLVIYDTLGKREEHLVNAIAGNTITLDGQIGGPGAYAIGSDVHVGLSAPYINSVAMLDGWPADSSQGGEALYNAGIFGANHVLAHAKNGIEIAFELQPPGLRHEVGLWIDVDVTRQIESVTRSLKNGAWENDLDNNTWPSGDVVNDENGYGDNDNWPIKAGAFAHDLVFSVDQPGFPNPANNGVTRSVQRLNALEFVRVALDKVAEIANDIDNTEKIVSGSRMSDKFKWHSRIDLLVGSGSTYLRNGAGDNVIDDEHVNLQLNSPW